MTQGEQLCNSMQHELPNTAGRSAAYTCRVDVCVAAIPAADNDAAAVSELYFQLVQLHSLAVCTLLHSCILVSILTARQGIT
jgi:hypothetical protein